MNNTPTLTLPLEGKGRVGVVYDHLFTCQVNCIFLILIYLHISSEGDIILVTFLGKKKGELWRTLTRYITSKWSVNSWI
jgi:hypothetical protein